MESKANRRLIGLTGGISTGKSTVAKYLETAYKLPILDADIYARDAVKVGSTAIKAIASRYGATILFADGSLNRQQLGNIIFHDASERQWLEKQIHPYVRDAFRREIDNSLANTIVLVVPLLFEAQMTYLVTETWVVYCNPVQQLARLRQRGGLTLEAAQARISSQMPIEEKCDRADLVLDNSSTLESLFKQVNAALYSA
jgi:dephospho-CoA kinase